MKLDCSAAEAPFKFQKDMIILISNLSSSRICTVLLYDVLLFFTWESGNFATH